MSDATIFECVRIYDEEVAKYVTDGQAIGAYAIERDLAMLGLPAEARPVIFRCRVLKRSQRDRVYEQSSEERQRTLAFRYGLLSIRNIPRPDGGVMDSWTASRGGKPDQALDESVMDALEAMGLGDADFWEVGSAIMGRSFLALGARPRCAVLDTSAHLWVAACTRHAERKTAASTAAASSSG